MKPRPNESGFASIRAILIFIVIASLLITASTARMNFVTRSVQGEMLMQQAYYLAQGAAAKGFAALQAEGGTVGGRSQAYSIALAPLFVDIDPLTWEDPELLNPRFEATYGFQIEKSSIALTEYPDAQPAQYIITATAEIPSPQGVWANEVARLAFQEGGQWKWIPLK
ncbi:MAG: hypothetical protein RBU29_04235 [bacterium]|jgi:hypothetical protein|nr:hypothetical protein [bacterium]